MTSATLADVLIKILISGLMGSLGQLVRTIAGLKLMSDWASSQDTSAKDAFVLHRLIISLFIGATAGIVAGLSLGIDPNSSDLSRTLLGLAAAGYAGTDFIEAFIRRIAPAAGGAARPDPEREVGRGAADAQAERLSAEIAAVGDSIADLHDAIRLLPSQPAAAVVHAAEPAAGGGLIDAITPDIVRWMFPDTPILNISRHLPSVLDGLRRYDLTDRDMILMALSTIRAETAGFVPLSEGTGPDNTHHYPFDLYEPGTHIGLMLGNTMPGDGLRFKGRGFVQLTGRSNYTRTAANIDVDLINYPNYANASRTAGIILGDFLKVHEDRIRSALATRDLYKARRTVNGGSNGIDAFVDAFHRGEKALPAERAPRAVA